MIGAATKSGNSVYGVIARAFDGIHAAIINCYNKIEMGITKYYNHARAIQDARKGMAIVNATQRGNEEQRYKVGEVVKSTECSPYKFTRGVIVDVYESNGFCYYVCSINGYTYTARKKDIELI